MQWDWRRLGLGVFAIALFVAAGVLWFARPNENSSFVETFRNSAFRGGFVVAALWLAYPQLVQLVKRFAPSTILGAIVVLAVLVIRPRAIIYVAPILGALLVLKLIRWLFAPLPQKRVPRRDSLKP